MLCRNLSSCYGAHRRCRPSLGVAFCALLVEPSQAAYLRRCAASSRGTGTAALLSSDHALLSVCKRCEHTATMATPPKRDLTTKEQVDELMDSFAEACELITDAKESVGTTYFADDMEDAEKQTQDVLNRWESLQAALEHKGTAEELQKVRNMYDLKIKQLKAELETVREAGGAG
ncbi:conserved hypothetical protein [Leishmania infantum JPCM5]|uniref:Uncharacterized protein n=2 Tax=Leishmania infantum TaxID=5671 RepID=A4IDC0_LEIIN|nr:conserved hypothetical protein [Leishmania infantum JPCM5]CAC9549664.1 hypothetical_protein_-_conserved [Leishmania infantum]CAM72851.1 conserved hypothetical protein [Leishmania infantum JPCM5]SUZ46529.1 hypothetical_protein_-_conserved [Leishmania infantum]|eukprot:XP_001469739.1 conserved hypothetical protein [Leishmania infantum JPCM5]